MNSENLQGPGLYNVSTVVRSMTTESTEKITYREFAFRAALALLKKAGFKRKATTGDTPTWGQAMNGQCELKSFLKKEGKIFTVITSVIFI